MFCMSSTVHCLLEGQSLHAMLDVMIGIICHSIIDICSFVDIHFLLGRVNFSLVNFCMNNNRYS